MLRRLAIVAGLTAVWLLLSGCAARSAPPTKPQDAPRYYDVPTFLRDADGLCVPWNGAWLCRRVRDVRAFILEQPA